MKSFVVEELQNTVFLRETTNNDIQSDDISRS